MNTTLNISDTLSLVSLTGNGSRFSCWGLGVVCCVVGVVTAVVPLEVGVAGSVVTAGNVPVKGTPPGCEDPVEGRIADCGRGLPLARVGLCYK